MENTQTENTPSATEPTIVTEAPVETTPSKPQRSPAEFVGHQFSVDGLVLTIKGHDAVAGVFEVDNGIRPKIVPAQEFLRDNIDTRITSFSSEVVAPFYRGE